MNNTTNLTATSTPNCTDIPAQYFSFESVEKPRNPKCGSKRESESEVNSLRREVIDLRIRLEARDNERTSKNSNVYTLIRQLDEAKNTIQVLHRILDEKTELLKDAAIAIEEHEAYQQSQQLESESKIKEMEEYIRILEKSVHQSNMLYSERSCSIAKDNSLTIDTGSQVDLQLDFPPFLESEPISEQEVDAYDLDDIKNGLDECDQTSATAYCPHDNVMRNVNCDDINCQLNKSFKENKHNKFVREKAMRKSMDADQINKTVCHDLLQGCSSSNCQVQNCLDKIDKLSERVHDLEKSVFANDNL